MELRLKAVIENIDRLTDFVNKQLDKMGCSRKARTQIDIALDELFSNICHYAYGTDDGYVLVHVEPAEDDSVRITLKDKGIPFDPLGRGDPDVSLGLHERGIGGLGIFMVKRTMDDLSYEYKDGVNVLTVVKALNHKIRQHRGLEDS